MVNSVDDIGVLAHAYGTSSSYTDVYVPGDTSNVSVGDVGMVLGETFIKVPARKPKVGEICYNLAVDVAPTKKYCVALEPPIVMPMLKGVGTTGPYYLMDTPLETDDDFDENLKLEPGYVKNETGISFWTPSEDEYADKETINYVYTLDDTVPMPYLRVGSTVNAPVYNLEVSYATGRISPPSSTFNSANPTGANGTVWDRKPFIPDCLSSPKYPNVYLKVAAYTYGRIVGYLNNTSGTRIVLVPGRLKITYNSVTKLLTVDKVGDVNISGTWVIKSSGKEADILRTYGSLPIEATIDVSGVVALKNTSMVGIYTDVLLDGTFFSKVINIDGDEQTTSFTEIIWFKGIKNWVVIENEQASVAVPTNKFVVTGNYYITPGGSGDGLTKETPGSWESVLGTMDSKGVCTYGIIGSSKSCTVIATIGNYSAEGKLLFVPANTAVVGGASEDFSTFTDTKSWFTSSVHNENGVIHNFSMRFRGLAAVGLDNYGQTVMSQAVGIGTYMYNRYATGFVTNLGSLVDCSIYIDAANVSPADNYFITATIYTGDIKNCSITGETPSCIISGSNMLDCSVDLSGPGIALVGNTTTYYDEEWDDSTGGYESVGHDSLYQLPVSSYATLICNDVRNSKVRITNYVDIRFDPSCIKNSEVYVSCTAGVITEATPARPGWYEKHKIKVDGTTTTWYDHVLPDTPEDQVKWLPFNSSCWKYVWPAAAQTAGVAGSYGSVMASVAVDCDITIIVPGSASTSSISGAPNVVNELTYPETEGYEEVLTGYDENGYPIYEYVEKTYPAHPYRTWLLATDGVSCGSSTMRLPQNMRNCKLTAWIGPGGVGGNGGGGEECPMEIGNDIRQSSEWLWFECQKIPWAAALGQVGAGGTNNVVSPVRWTADCVFDITIGQNGLSGRTSLLPPKRSKSPGCIGRPGGESGSSTNGALLGWGVVQGGSVCIPYYDNRDSGCTSGWYGADGGVCTNPDGTSYQASGGNGIPMPGYTHVGNGAIKLGDYWE